MYSGTFLNKAAKKMSAAGKQVRAAPKAGAASSGSGGGMAPPQRKAPSTGRTAEKPCAGVTPSAPDVPAAGDPLASAISQHTTVAPAAANITNEAHIAGGATAAVPIAAEPMCAEDAVHAVEPGEQVADVDDLDEWQVLFAKFHVEFGQDSEELYKWCWLLQGVKDGTLSYVEANTEATVMFGKAHAAASHRKQHAEARSGHAPGAAVLCEADQARPQVKN